MAGHLINDTEIEKSEVLNCIDLSNPDINHSARLLKQACENEGFFYVINHGISTELINEVFALAKKFFALSYDEKMKIRGKSNQGYKVNYLFDEETNLRAHQESFTTFHGADRDKENIWPPSDVLPRWKETMLRYHQATLNLMKSIARIIAIALDLNIDFFDQPELLGNAQSVLGFNHNGVEGLDGSKESLLGIGPHSDPYIITLLATDDVPGLQICRNMDAKPRLWKNVPPLKGAFIVNIGDMLERMTNHRFRSTNHRVIYRQERYTIPSFIFPSPKGFIDCLPSCKSAQNPPKYPPISCEDFVNIFVLGNIGNKQAEKD